MSYSGTVRRLLISCPSDVSRKHLSVIHKTIAHWNGVYGPHFATAVVPISWGSHAAAEFGLPAQEIINGQLTDTCDGCLAIFANRLGTPTASAESGTAEEIQRLADAGRYVAVLRSAVPVEPTSIDAAQFTALGEYLAKIQMNGLVLTYGSEPELAERVQNVLATFVMRDKARTEVAIETSTAAPPAMATAEVWPRVESSESVRSDSRGRLKTRRNWHVVLHNTGNTPARNVTFSLDTGGGQGNPWMVIGGRDGTMPTVPVLAPNSDVRFPLIVAFGVAPQVQCTVSWDDDSGRRSNEATLRL